MVTQGFLGGNITRIGGRRLFHSSCFTLWVASNIRFVFKEVEKFVQLIQAPVVAIEQQLMEPTTSLSEIIDEKVASSPIWTHFAFHNTIQLLSATGSRI